MLMMPQPTQTQRVLELARQRGLLRSRDLQAVDAPRVMLTRMTASGQLEKVGRGLYRLPQTQMSEDESLTAITEGSSSSSVFIGNNVSCSCYKGLFLRTG